MPAPIDISAALGSDPGVGPAPEPGGSMDFGLDDPTAGIDAEEGLPEGDETETDEDPDLATCEQVFPDWTPEQHQGLLDLIDARSGRNSGMEPV